MAEKKKIRLIIKSDGTPEGTSLVVNGSDVTKTLQVTGIHFSAYSDGQIYISWRTLEKDDKGVEKSVSYSFDSNPQEKTIVTKRAETVVIGKDSEIQYETEADKASHKLTDKLKQLTDVVEIKDLDKKEEKK